MGKQIVVVGDTQVGSAAALWPLRQQVEGGNVVEANKCQTLLYSYWQTMIEEVGELDSPTLVVNGDMLQGVNNKDGELVTNNLASQQAGCLTLYRPLRERCGKVYVVRGTGWHDGRAGENIERLAEALGAERNPATGQHTWWELYLETGAGVVHFTHHISVSSVPNYEATAPLRDLITLISELLRAYASQAPNVKAIVRNHRHRSVYVQAPPDLHALVVPAWQLKGEYTFKKAPVTLPHIGYAVLSVAGGVLHCRLRYFAHPRPHVEVA